MRSLKDYQPKSYSSFDGTKIYYETGGHSQEELLFLHGLGGDLTAWDKEREYFQKKGYKTIAVDLRGHGMSQRPNNQSDYDIKNFAKDIIELIKIEKLNNFYLIGHCFGGMVAITTEALYHPSIKGLILVDTNYKRPVWSEIVASNVLLEKIFNLLLQKSPVFGNPSHADYSKFKNTGDFDPKRIFSDVFHTTLKGYLLATNSLMEFDASSLLQKINVPTLVIEGSEDHIFPPDVAKNLHERIKTSELKFIPKANHILIINNPKELSKSIEEFVEKCGH